MKIYNYHPETKRFLFEENAEQSPLEPGIFLIPAHSTTIKPPEIKDDEIAIWNDSEWVIKKILESPKDLKFCPLLKHPCIESQCMWFIDEECAITTLTKLFPSTQN